MIQSWKRYVLVTGLFLSGNLLCADEPVLTMYRNNLAFVQEFREVRLGKGESDLHISGIPEEAMFESFAVRFPKGLQLVSLERGVNEDGREFRKELLMSLVGKTVYLTGRDGASREGTLLSVGQDYAAVRTGNKVIITSGEEMAFDWQAIEKPFSEPGGVRIKVRNGRDFDGVVSYSYLTPGCSWRAIYTMLIEENEDAADLIVDMQLANYTRSDFKGYRARLIAGDISFQNGYPGPVRPFGAGKMELDSRMMQPQVESGDYYTISLPDRITLLKGEQKRVPWKVLAHIPVQKAYEVSFSPGRSASGQRQHAAIQLTVVNDPEKVNEFLPAGQLFVYRKQEAPVLVGSVQFPDLPVGQETGFTVGYTYDIVANKKHLDHRQLNKREFQDTYRITVANSSGSIKKVQVNDTLYGAWEILESSLKYEQKDAQTAGFLVTVSPGKEQTITYTVKTTR